jgi:hypothetical protein
MAANISQNNFRARDTAGIRDRRALTYTGPTSYPNSAGNVGDPITAGDVFLGTIDVLDLPSVVLDVNGLNPLLVVVQPVTRSLLYRIHFLTIAGAETANGTNLSTYSIDFEVLGK